MTPEDSGRLHQDLAALSKRIDELRSSIDEHARAIHAAEETREHRSSNRDAMPVVVSFDKQAVTNAKADTDRQYRTQNAIKNWTVAAVIAAMIYAALTFLLLTESHTSSQQAVLQNRISRYALVTVNRSDVEIIHKQQPEDLDLQYVDLKDLQRLSFKVWMENVGKVTLSRMNYRFVVEILNASQAPSLNYARYNNYGAAGPLRAGDERQVEVYVPNTNNTGPIEVTPEVLNDLRQGNKYVAIFGRIDYEDVFGSWWNEFCVWRSFYSGTPIKYANASGCIAYDKQGGSEKADGP